LEDQRIPLLLWWAIEAKAESDRGVVLSLFEEPKVWDLPLARTFGVKNLAKRYAMAGGVDNLASCEKLMLVAQSFSSEILVMEGMAAGFEGGKVPELPAALAAVFKRYMQAQMEGDLVLAVKGENPEGVRRAISIVSDKKAPSVKRGALIQALADSANPSLIPVLVSVLSSSGEIGLKKVALSVAGKYDDKKLAAVVVAEYERRLGEEPGLRDAAHRMLAGRKEWAVVLLEQILKHRVRKENIAPDIVHQLRQYQDSAMDAVMKIIWPPVSSSLGSLQMQEESRRIQSIVAAGTGSGEKGKLIYSQRCASCHTLFQEGGKIGPELTGYERQSLDFWSVAILDPSIEIREGFGAYICKLRDGQIQTGMLEKQDATGIVLKDLAGQAHAIRIGEITSLDASPVSVMPVGLLNGLSDSDLRDLFSYLMKP